MKLRLSLNAVILLVCGMAATSVLGCGDEGEDDPFRTYFAAEIYGQPACDDADALLSGRRELRLFQNGTDDLPTVTRGLQRYYRRHGLSFFTRANPTKLTLDYALDTDNASLGSALVQKFPDVDFADDAKLMADKELYQQVLTFTLNFIFKPVTTFARDNASGRGITNLILLHQLERPGGMKIFPPGALLAGLAISPPLLQVFTSTGLPEGNLWKGLDLPADFSPMMFLDGRVLGLVAKQAPVLGDLVVAHEFGHTNALIHRDTPNNLMYPTVAIGRDTCADFLEADQITTARAALGFSPVRQALVRSDQAAVPTTETGSAGVALKNFSPRRFVSLLRGDSGALADLLGPLVHPIQ